MAESKHETELEETEGLEQPPKKKRRHTKLRRWVSRIIALLITIVLVVGAVYVVVHRDTISIDSVRRSLSNLVNGETQADSYTLKGDTSSCTAAFQGGFLVCSQTDLQLFARSGKQRSMSPSTSQSLWYPWPDAMRRSMMRAVQGSISFGTNRSCIPIRLTRRGPS